MLKALGLDGKRSKILQKLELCLDILGGTVERISSTAEVLGAVHQVNETYCTHRVHHLLLICFQKDCSISHTILRYMNT